MIFNVSFNLVRPFFQTLAIAVTLSACGSGDDPQTPGGQASANFSNAAIVIGQADFTGKTSNQDAFPDANTLSVPFGNPMVINNVLYVPDFGNNRLLGFDSIPAANNTTADFVLGQTDFTTIGLGLDADKFSGVRQIFSNGSKTALVSQTNHRVLIWNSVPASGSDVADLVLGQPDFVSNATSCDNLSFNKPASVAMTADKLIVNDAGNNRVLIWNTIPTTDNAPPSLILGQVGYSNCAANDNNDDGVTDSVSATTLDNPTGAWSDGTRLVIADQNNNRVLIWNSFPTSNTTAADVVLGQNSFFNNMVDDDDQNGAPDTSPTARTLDGPYGVYSDGVKLYVADLNNSRILVWNTFPNSNFAAADVVYGQSDFTHQVANDDDQDGVIDSAATARTLNSPAGVYSAGNQLIVVDGGNNRYLIYNQK